MPLRDKAGYSRSACTFPLIALYSLRYVQIAYQELKVTPWERNINLSDFHVCLQRNIGRNRRARFSESSNDHPGRTRT